MNHNAIFTFLKLELFCIKSSVPTVVVNCEAVFYTFFQTIIHGFFDGKFWQIQI